MKQIHLHGSLGARFGGPFSLVVRDPAEAVRALSCQLAGFRDALAVGDWHVVRGDLDAGEPVEDDDALHMALGHASEIHILPAGTGAGQGGVGKALAGVALIGAAFFTGGLALGALTISSGTLGAIGAGLAVAGVSQMLATTSNTDTYDEREKPDERPSFMFDGPVNTSTQGLPVPVVYGHLRVGSVVVSAGMTAEELDQ